MATPSTAPPPSHAPRARLVLVGVAALALVGVASCGSSDSSSLETLPPIRTTTSTSTTTTTVSTEIRYYTVKRGDTLSKIAAALGVTVESIVALNGLTNPDDIQSGQELKIPPPGLVIDSLPEITTSIAPTST
jgi:LysM repeat protein